MPRQGQPRGPQEGSGQAGREAAEEHRGRDAEEAEQQAQAHPRGRGRREVEGAARPPVRRHVVMVPGGRCVVTDGEEVT
ncbi:hypothetical protein GCM10028771_13250 [Nocardioides marmoraquaticus]